MPIVWQPAAKGMMTFSLSPAAVVGQDDQGGELVRVGEEDHRLRRLLGGIDVGQRPEDDVALRDLRDREARDEALHQLRRLDVPLAVDEVVVGLAPAGRA